MSSTPKLTLFERFLTLITKVRPGEGRVVALFGAHVFLVLFSYYLFRAARSGFLLDKGSAVKGAYATAVIAALLETLVEQQEERVVMGGAANLARFGPDFPHSIQPVLEALEEQVVLLRLLGEATDPSVLTVRIGHENPVEGLTSTSVVSVGYGSDSESLA